jgi:hypothetical protein
MEINGVNNNYYDYAPSNVQADKANSSTVRHNDEETNKQASSTNVAATYESSSSTIDSIHKNNSMVIAQLKAESQKRIDQMQSLVTQMFQKQGIKIGSSDEMWKMLAGGNFTADPDTIAQAKNDISENGYWGVSQTSDRIFSFAIALSGGDEEKMQKMVSAVEKGFSSATKAWGKKLPSITQDTHDAIMKKFDDWFSSNGSSAKTSDILNS